MFKMKNSYKRFLVCTAALLAVLFLVNIFGKITVYAANGYEKAAENDLLILYYQADTLAIQIENKLTGTVYSSTGQTEPKEGDLNSSWQGMMDSGISIDCRQPNGSSRTWSITTEGTKLHTSLIENGFESEIDFPEGISMKLCVVLTEQGIEISIPEESIKDDIGSGYTLQSIYLYPFLGATYGTDNHGYLFVPDGSGALIDTSVQTLGTEPYEKQIYGSDISMGSFQGRKEANMLKDAEQIYMPVFGSILTTNEDGMAVIIDEGAEYCNVVAYASGIRTPYNMIMPKFLIRETYQMKLTQSGSSMVANQEERNNYGIRAIYTILSGDDADYVGIARAYQSYLLEKGILSDTEEVQDHVPMKLEILLSEQEEQLFWSTTVVMTTKDQADTIVQEFYDQGIKNLDVVLRGYSSQGATGAAPSKFSFTGKVGSKGAWKDFIQKYAGLGIDVSLYADFSRGYDGIGGFGNGQKVQGIDQTILETFDYAKFTWLSTGYAAEKFEAFAKKAANMNFSGLAVDAFGKNLYSNWNKKSLASRTDAISLYQNVDGSGLKLALYSPSAYLYEQTDAIYDIPTDSSGYYIFTDTVPFMQIVLKGYLPYYSGAWNFHADAVQELLRCIDYGMYPNWYVTWEDPIELINTPSNWLYSSQYGTWKDSIASRYMQVDEALQKVMGSQITDRTMLTKNVVRIDYSNGISIYVNYGTNTWEGEGISVDAESFLVKEGVAS